MSEFEVLLREALSPIDPPEELEARLEERLTTLVEAAVEELEGWELATMSDPRNWLPTVAAAGVGSAAAVGLVLVRTQRKRHRRRAASDNVVELAGSAVRDLAREAGKVIEEGRRRL